MAEWYTCLCQSYVAIANVIVMLMGMVLAIVAVILMALNPLQSDHLDSFGDVSQGASWTKGACLVCGLLVMSAGCVGFKFSQTKRRCLGFAYLGLLLVAFALQASAVIFLYGTADSLSKVNEVTTDRLNTSFDPDKYAEVLAEKRKQSMAQAFTSFADRFDNDKYLCKFKQWGTPADSDRRLSPPSFIATSPDEVLPFDPALEEQLPLEFASAGEEPEAQCLEYCERKVRLKENCSVGAEKIQMPCTWEIQCAYKTRKCAACPECPKEPTTTATTTTLIPFTPEQKCVKTELETHCEANAAMSDFMNSYCHAKEAVDDGFQETCLGCVETYYETWDVAELDNDAENPQKYLKKFQGPEGTAFCRCFTRFLGTMERWGDTMAKVLMVCCVIQLGLFVSVCWLILCGPSDDAESDEPPSQEMGARPGMVQVQCPPGCGPGALISVSAPDGRQVQVAVPPNVGPGQMFTVQT